MSGRASRSVAVAILGIVLAAAGVRAADAASHHLGVGLHYWTALDDLDDQGFDLEEEGTSALLSWLIDPAGLLKFDVDLEYFGDGFGGANGAVWAPQAYVLVGGSLYGGVGVGVSYSDDFEDEFSDPYWLARVGLDLTVLPRVSLDLNANYQADSFNALDQADSDSVTLGAIVRLQVR